MKMSHLDKNNNFRLTERPEDLSPVDSFKVPDGYFDTLETQIIAKIELISQLEKTATKDQFSVPANYFEELPAAIQQRISFPEKKYKLKEWMTILLRPQISLAFASLIILLWFALKTRETKIIESPASVITLEDLGNSEYLHELDEYTLIEMLATQQEIGSANITTDPYVEYLLDHNIEISQIETNL